MMILSPPPNFIITLFKIIYITQIDVTIQRIVVVYVVSSCHRTTESD